MAVVQQQQTKKVFNKPKSDPLERKMQNDKQIATETNRPKSWPNKLEVIFIPSFLFLKFTFDSYK